jgi:diacylglycerol kinase family enzyme
VGGLLLVNPRSGDGGVDELVSAARGLGVTIHVLGDGDDAAEIARTADEDVVGMAGGDGSLAPVAAAVQERGAAFVCVPFGTRNHFARDLGLDRRDPIAALAAFGDGEERRVDLARANDHPFLNNVSLGLYARLVHRRERHRRRRDAFARLRALGLVAANRQPIGITIDGDHIRAPVVLVSSNHYALDVLSLGARERLDDGCLHLYVPRGLLRARWDERVAERFLVDARAPHLQAALDGEPMVLEAPVELTIAPRALRVLVPRSPQ